MLIKDAAGKTIANVTVFRDPAAAQRWADGMKAGMVVMGDAPSYWVCTMAHASRLERAGYELAPRAPRAAADGSMTERMGRRDDLNRPRVLAVY